MKILVVCPMANISSTARLRALTLMEIYGKENIDVISIDAKPLTMLYRIRNKLFNLGFSISVPDRNEENKKIIEMILEKKYDILWVDKGITIRNKTLDFVKKINPEIKLVNFSLDTMTERHCQSKQYLECMSTYDYHITTKSFAIEKLYKMGAKKVLYTHQGYDEHFHYERDVSLDDIKRLGCDVGFVGMWEKERCNSILFLTRNGIDVRVFGNKKWKKYKNDNTHLHIESHGLYDDDYAKSFKCYKISLCFLRKINHDLHTSRTMEIPACGGFMLAERTNEHKMLFEENKEAVYFSDDFELLEKCRYYLENDDERNKIAHNGHLRCINSKYSNKDILIELIKKIME